MPIVNFKNQLEFPPIGHIRKGAPKGDNRPGRDLQTAFRVTFDPGKDNAASEGVFAATYGSLLPPEINQVTLAFDTVDENWEAWYEAYTAGRMIARADGEKYIRLVDPNTGLLVIHNGEPHRDFDPKKPVAFLHKGDKRIPIMAKPAGRLKVIIKPLKRFAYLTLHTSSIYDCLNITKQLNALAMVTGNHLSGIPLTIRRRPTEITWNKDDGSAVRMTHGLISIEADPSWVGLKLEVMSRLALPDSMQQALPMPGEDENGEDWPLGEEDGGYNQMPPGPTQEEAPVVDRATTETWNAWKQVADEAEAIPIELPEQIVNEDMSETQLQGAIDIVTGLIDLAKKRAINGPNDLQVGKKRLSEMGVDELTALIESPKSADEVIKNARIFRDMKIGQ